MSLVCLCLIHIFYADRLMSVLFSRLPLNYYIVSFHIYLRVFIAARDVENRPDVVGRSCGIDRGPPRRTRVLRRQVRCCGNVCMRLPIFIVL